MTLCLYDFYKLGEKSRNLSVLVFRSSKQLSNVSSSGGGGGGCSSRSTQR